MAMVTAGCNAKRIPSANSRIEKPRYHPHPEKDVLLLIEKIIPMRPFTRKETTKNMERAIYVPSGCINTQILNPTMSIPIKTCIHQFLIAWRTSCTKFSIMLVLKMKKCSIVLASAFIFLYLEAKYFTRVSGPKMEGEINNFPIKK